MLKSIKKTINILLYSLAVLLLTSFILAVVLRVPVVQSYIANGVARYISKQINSTVSVGDIEFTFFNRLIVNKILIKDQHNDTLLYTPRVVVGIRYFNLNKGILRLGKATVFKPEVALITDSSGVMNLNWYLDKLSSTTDTASLPSAGSSVTIGRVDITEGKFSLIDRRSSKSLIPIDFSNLVIDSIFGTVENFSVRCDSVDMSIRNLAFNEKSGFRVKNFNSDLLLEGQNIIFTNVNLSCNNSNIDAPKVGLLADSAASFGNFLKEVRLDIRLRKSLIASSDLNHFVAFNKEINESVWLSGNVKGTVSELKGRNIKISYKDETNLDLDFDLSGLPDVSNTFIFLQINDFRSISKDIEQISIPGKGNILLPEVLRKLGVVSFSGTFTGFTTDFVTYGKINTNKGIIATDISLRPTGDNKFMIKGFLKGTDIDLGELTGNPDFFGKITAEANIDGSTDSFKTLAVNAKGRVDSVEINDYIYRNIDLNGYFKDKAWDGKISIEDRNIKLDLLGMFDFNKELPEFDFTLNLKKADLYRLNFDRSDTSSRASLLLTANFTGNTLDNLNGEIKLLNSSFRKYSNDLEIYDFSIRTFAENSNPSIVLRTDFVDANLTGHYSFAGLRDVVNGVLSALVPSKFVGLSPATNPYLNDFVFDIRFKNTDGLNKFLKTGIQLAAGSNITGLVKPDSVISLTGNLKMLSVNNNVFNDLSFNATYEDSVFKADVSSQEFNLSGISDLKDLNLKFSFIPDYFDLDLNWDNHQTSVINKGNFKANGEFSRSDGTAGRELLTVNLLPGEIVSRNTLWKINPAVVAVDSNAIRISRFRISNNENYFLIDGAVSENPADTLYMKFNGIDIKPLNNLYEKSMGNSSDIIPLSIGGVLNGSISLTDVYRNFMFESDILINNFSILNTDYGKITIGSVWNNNLKVAEIKANNDLNGSRMFDITGHYDPATAKVNLNAITDKLPIDFLNPLLSSFASGISGTASGKINFSGEFAKPVLTGSVWGENATMKVDYLQTKYMFNDSIRFDKSGIKFNNIQLKDEKGNSTLLSGAVYHTYFQDWGVDITLNSTDCMVLNTKPKDNDLFYGTAYASGVTSIKTIGNLLKFNISAKTGKNTRFFIPLNSGMSVSENNFVTFVQPASVDKKEESQVKNNAASTSTEFDMTFDLEISPDAEIQLIMDPKVGDIIKGTGSANLNISLNPKGEFRIFGDYTISNGDYLFTLGSLVNKEFSVESGGMITFNGDVENADIDMKAIYKTKASLSDIMPELQNEPKQSERIPVECQLLLTGKLFNPVVGFNIYLPTANESTRAYLKNMINSDEEMSRQFLFLLVMNRFYSEQAAGNAQPVPAGMGSETMGVTTMEMLSNQVSNWLSQISNDFDIGVNYRPGSSTLPNSQELQVALSTQILNDRVKINGNFDVAGSQAARSTGAPSGTNTITGAFDIEYAINDKIKFKFFNRSNDNFYMDNGILYTQGIGLFYRQDFNKLKDLFKKRDKSEMKKEEETRPKKNK
jgi:hypothetical protein